MSSLYEVAEFVYMEQSAVLLVRANVTRQFVCFMFVVMLAQF